MSCNYQQNQIFLFLSIVNRKRKRRSVKGSDDVTLPPSTKKKRLSSSGAMTTGKYSYHPFVLGT